MKRFSLIFALLMLAGLVYGQWHTDEDFEGITTLPAGWVVFDDGDGMAWRILNHANAHSGTRAAFVDNYFPNQNADWMVTPLINVSPGDSLIFYTRAWVSTENLQIFVSNSTPNPAGLNQLLADIEDIGTQYRRVSLSLDAWAGQGIYIGFYWECDTYGILVDDVKIGQPLNVIPEINLPDAISFFQSDTYTMDLEPYIYCTDPSFADISSMPNEDLNVVFNGLGVQISSNGFLGTSQLEFTLTDLLTGLTASDILSVTVEPDPTVDLYIEEVLSPRINEFLGMPFFPKVRVKNLGTEAFENQIQISMDVTDDEGAILHSDVALQNISLAPQQSSVICFPLDFAPTIEGEHIFSFVIETPDANQQNNELVFVCHVMNRTTVGGPDESGYRFIDSNNPLGPEYDWIDISQTGTSTVTYGVTGWGGDDNFSEPIPLGFSFPFYGSSYDYAFVDINGEILLAANNWYTPYPSTGWDNDGNMFNYVHPIPGYAAMPGLIAVCWDDLNADEGTGNVYFQSFGEAPDRYVVFQWHDLRFLAGTGGTPQLRFQVIMHENGNIKMQYHTVATGQTGANVPHDNGLSATVALQNEAANAGLVYLREIIQGNQYQGIEPAGNMLHPELAILFYTSQDEQAPIITHTPAGNTFHQDLELTARIIDMSELESTALFYNTGSGWQSISPFASDQNYYHYQLSQLPTGSTLEYYFEAQDIHGNTSRLPQNAPDECFGLQILPTANAQVLIAYSGSQDYQRIELPIYEGILSQLDIAYDIYNWEEYPQYAIPPQYQGVIAYANSGSTSDKMYYFASALCDYLDLGTAENPKNIWFSSDGLASSQHAHPNSSSVRRLMRGYFRTSYVPTGFGGGTNGLGGPDNYYYEHGTILALPGTQVGTVNREYPVYANSPDCIFPETSAGDIYWDEVPYPETGAIYTYAFEGGPINGHAYLYHGVAATQVQTPSYRSMYFSFDFSQLSNPDDRHEWMQDLMNWWQISPSDSDDHVIPAQSLGIQAIYPNPFNPSTTIKYHLGTAGMTKLAVYNLKGQRVKTLVNEPKPAGSHNVVFNGQDDLGRPLSSGVYFIRMQARNLCQTRKITIIK